MSVLVAVADLFFASKIDAAGKGAPRAKRGEDLVAQVRREKPARLLVELGATAFGGPAIDAIRVIKSDPELAATQVVGYCRHTEVDRIRAAKTAGADRVLTQGEFAELLPSLLEEGSALPKGAASCD
ncbi:MAG TPA: hypothetical protein VMV18_08455 [bacterium]|nr:hypothetical protein [bacterium]